jgi:hypothetical protein
MKYTGRWTVQALPGGGGSSASISMGAGPGSSRHFAPGKSSEPGHPVTPWSGGPWRPPGTGTRLSCQLSAPP